MTEAIRILGRDVELRISGSLWDSVLEHLLSDNDEHGGVVLCGVSRTARAVRLLARSFRPAIEDNDYVASEVGYKALTSAFTLDAALESQRSGLIPLFIHNHGGQGRVKFSAIDLASHTRGYPALTKIAGRSVGALVVAKDAVAGDIWNVDGSRSKVSRTVIVTTPVIEITPEPASSPAAPLVHDRHARLFGDAGIEILHRSKIGVIGAGGVGMLAIQWLSMLGIGEIVAVDPGRVKRTNRSRLPGATRFDARDFHILGTKVSSLLSTPGTRKIKLARRLARGAGMGTRLTGMCCLASDDRAIDQLKDCDFIVLAADSDVARLAANRISHQYLIPMVQAGSKVVVADDGKIKEVFAVVRPVVPDCGCLACAEIISAKGISMEITLGSRKDLADYGTKQPAPSVAALNAVAASNATIYLQLMLTGLHEGGDIGHFTLFPMRTTFTQDVTTRSSSCRTCGVDGVTALGDLQSLRIPTSR